jgi:hypothetical protein
LDALAYCIRTTDLDDVVKARLARGQASRCQSPVLVLIVIEDVVGAETSQKLEFRW